MGPFSIIKWARFRLTKTSVIAHLTMRQQAAALELLAQDEKRLVARVAQLGHCQLCKRLAFSSRSVMVSLGITPPKNRTSNV